MNWKPYRKAFLFLTTARTRIGPPPGSSNANSTASPTIVPSGIMAAIPDSLTSNVRPWINSPVRQWISTGISRLNLEFPRCSFGKSCISTSPVVTQNSQRLLSRKLNLVPPSIRYICWQLSPSGYSISRAWLDRIPPFSSAAELA
jgi:hypothetical protein